jgi:hypothetical protein
MDCEFYIVVQTEQGSGVQSLNPILARRRTALSCQGKQAKAVRRRLREIRMCQSRYLKCIDGWLFLK